MRKSSPVFFALLFFCSALFAQSPSNADQARAAAEHVGEAWSKNDVARLDSMLADDYTHTDTDGKILTKQQYMAYIHDRAAKHISNKIEFKDVKARELNGAVVVIGENIVSGGLANEKVNAGEVFHIRFTQIWVRRAGKWQRLYFQGTPIL